MLGIRAHKFLSANMRHCKDILRANASSVFVLKFNGRFAILKIEKRRKFSSRGGQHSDVTHLHLRLCAVPKRVCTGCVSVFWKSIKQPWPALARYRCCVNFCNNEKSTKSNRLLWSPAVDCRNKTEWIISSVAISCGIGSDTYRLFPALLTQISSIRIHAYQHSARMSQQRNRRRSFCAGCSATI